MVLGGRKRRDSALFGAWVPGVRRPGNEGSGEQAAGWASGHNRRRQARKEPRGQPRRAEPSLAGTGSCSRWFPREGGTGPAAGRWEAAGVPSGWAEVWLSGVPRGAFSTLCFPGGSEDEWAQRAGALAWQMASLSGSLPFCQGAGEMMSPGRTRNRSEGSSLTSFCRLGFLARLCFVLRG